MTIPNVLLKQHVRESNAIEGITNENGPLFDQHLQVAQAVAKNPDYYVQNMCAIHWQLMSGTPYPEGQTCGVYRSCCVYVGNREMPGKDQVPRLMEHWYKLCAQVKVGDGKACLCLHYLALCIHPFADGNGRATRLHYNALRLTAGLPWKIIFRNERSEYYAQIRSIEDNLFPAFVQQAFG